MDLLLQCIPLNEPLAVDVLGRVQTHEAGLFCLDFIRQPRHIVARVSLQATHAVILGSPARVIQNDRITAIFLEI